MAFLIFIAVLVALSLVMYILCYLYCKRRKRTSGFHGLDDIGMDNLGLTLEKSKSINNPNTSKDAFMDKFKHLAVSWLDSLLRITLFITAYIPSHSIRNFLYGHVFCVSMGRKVVIYYGLEIRAPWNLYIDEGTTIGDHCILDARSGIYIGKNVNFSTGAAVWTLQHDVNDPKFGVEGERKPVFIFDRSWVSTRAVILPGCIVNEGSVIAGGGTLQRIHRPLEYTAVFHAKRLAREILT